MGISEIIRNELSQDRVSDDVTAALLKETGYNLVEASIVAKADGVVSGLEVTKALNEIYGEAISISLLKSEGDRVEKGQTVLALRGSLKEVLGIERTLLNFLSHLSGIATETRRYVDAVRPHAVKILATRKTLPGLRDLQLKAVVAGGGHIHRRSLSDGILIKENHQNFESSGTLLDRALEMRSPLHRIEIEVQDFKALENVLSKSPDIIMLDNFSLEDLAKAIPMIRKKGTSEIEVSGGVRLETIRAIAELEPDSVSVGALTHSSAALDLSLDIVGIKL